MSDLCDARKCKREWEFHYHCNGVNAKLCPKHWDEAAKGEVAEWVKRRCGQKCVRKNG